MTTIARSISMVRSGNASHAVRAFISRKVESVVVSTVTWLISKPAIQQAIVDQFENRSTPMCRALNAAVGAEVESQVGKIDVDADDVNGLSRYFEDAMEEALKNMPLSDIQGFDEEVERVVNGMDTTDVVENVVEAIADALSGARSRRGR
jgi:hypothetical protein